MATETTTEPPNPMWWETPLQSRSEHFASANPADFPALSARQAEWRLSPIDALAALADGTLDGSRYDVSIDGAAHEWVAMADAAGTVALPEDLLAARAWDATIEALRITISGAGDPVVIVRDLDGVRAGHLVIDVAPHTTRTVILDNRGGVALAENVEIVIGNDADVRIVHLAEWADPALHVATHSARIGRGAHLDHVLVSLGGGVSRVNPTFLLDGEGSSVDALGVYFADRGRHIEHRVFVHHIAPHTTSNVLYKGVLHGSGTRTVWVGDVLIGSGATGTNSYEANRNLVLSDGARADSIPNLEIETGDIVGAGHASATGRLDDDHLFYLQSRGISEIEARRLVALGFLLEVIGTIHLPELEERLTARFTAELDAIEANA